MKIHKTRIHVCIFVAAILTSAVVSVLAQTSPTTKPKLTLDEYFNCVNFPALEVSPDGNSVIIAVERADWDQQIFRSDLWLWHDDGRGGSLVQLTQSGHDSEPKWSPDGKWIAFLSERKASSEKSDSDSDSDSDPKDEATAQVYLISPNGGEAFPITQGDEEVHTFAWSADSRTIYYATRQPWTKTQKDDYKKNWKDVVQYRTAERGDAIFALDLAAALTRHAAAPATSESDSDKDDLTPGARPISTRRCAWRR
jgi:dipeptidyl aminopeptidase/acylaminoacyl peptidase